MAEHRRPAWAIHARVILRHIGHAFERAGVRAMPAGLRSERNHYRHAHIPQSFGPQIQPSAQALDLAYVVAEKDFAVLGPSLDSVRRFLRHPLKTIHVISAASPQIQAFCREQNCHWVDERQLMGFGPESLGLKIDGRDRSGWLYQQLIKLSLDMLSPAQPVYVLDADILLASPQVFTWQDKTVMLVSDERHAPYRSAYQRLMGRAPRKDFSFVAHQMVFDPQRLPLLRAQIEQAHPGRLWWQAVVDSYQPGALSGFSEFETYGNWMAENFPGEVTYEYWANRRLPRAWLDRADQYVLRCKGKVRSASLHAHDR